MRVIPRKRWKSRMLPSPTHFPIHGPVHKWMGPLCNRGKWSTMMIEALDADFTLLAVVNVILVSHDPAKGAVTSFWKRNPFKRETIKKMTPTSHPIETRALFRLPLKRLLDFWEMWPDRSRFQKAGRSKWRFGNNKACRGWWNRSGPMKKRKWFPTCRKTEALFHFNLSFSPRKNREIPKENENDLIDFPFDENYNEAQWQSEALQRRK